MNQEELIISIENILSIAPSKIYQRGLDYYRSNKIVNIERKNNDISAEVEGSNGEIYEVSIDFDKNGNVKFYDCDCPYDGGPICKHIIAVLLKLSENDMQYNLPLEEMLESLTKEKEYQSCCKEIKSLYDAGGSAEAKRLVMLLKNKYQRKPAFLDELNKIK